MCKEIVTLTSDSLAGMIDCMRRRGVIGVVGKKVVSRTTAKWLLGVPSMTERSWRR